MQGKPAVARRFASMSFLAVLLLASGGCACLPKNTGEAPLLQKAATRGEAGLFTLDGRIAVHDGERHYASNLYWQHDVDRDELLFTTPLGQGIAELTRNNAGARLVFADRRELTATGWENLAAQVFGIPLPLTALPRWLKAEAPADASDIRRDATGRLQQLRIDGWLIRYLDYESEQATALPTLIELEHGDIAVRLKIDAWSDVK